MHLAEGTLPFNQALGWSAMALPVLIWSIRGESVKNREDSQSTVVIAGVTSILFAATLLPLPVPVVGATSHICLTPLFALVVGLRRIIWPTFFILLLQAIFFAHGGLTTLGVNMLALGFVGPLFAILLLSICRKFNRDNFFTLGLACGLGGLSVYIFDAVVLGLALSDAVQPMTTFFTVLMGFAPVQIPLSILEAFVSVKIVQLLLRRRPDLLSFDLSALSTAKVPKSMIALLIVMIFLSGCTYEGIDGTVFGEVSTKAGHPPTDSVIDFSQGELGLSMSVLILFGLGFIAGQSWQKISVELDDES